MHHRCHQALSSLSHVGVPVRLPLKHRTCRPEAAGGCMTSLLLRFRVRAAADAGAGTAAATALAGAGAAADPTTMPKEPLAVPRLPSPPSDVRLSRLQAPKPLESQAERDTPSRACLPL